MVYGRRLGGGSPTAVALLAPCRMRTSFGSGGLHVTQPREHPTPYTVHRHSVPVGAWLALSHFSGGVVAFSDSSHLSFLGSVRALCLPERLTLESGRFGGAVENLGSRTKVVLGGRYVEGVRGGRGLGLTVNIRSMERGTRGTHENSISRILLTYSHDLDISGP